MSSGTTPDERVEPTVEGLYRHLREQILDGVLAPGEAISQAGLANRYGVTRTPMREALRLLQREGLVEAEFNRRVRVSQLSMEELEQLYAQRILHETLALRLGVPRFTADDLAQLRALHERMLELADPDRFVEWEHVHREFHALLVSYGGERLTAFILQLADHGRRYRHELLVLRGQLPSADVFGVGMPEHLSIVEACERRAVADAGSLLARHLGRTALNLVSINNPLHEPTIVREALRLAIPDS